MKPKDEDREEVANVTIGTKGDYIVAEISPDGIDESVELLRIHKMGLSPSHDIDNPSILAMTKSIANVFMVRVFGILPDDSETHFAVVDDDEGAVS